MPNPSVSSIVGSIVSAFDSGMDVFRRLQMRKQGSRPRRTSRKNTRDHDDEEELHLLRSLQTGSCEIMTEYDRSTRRFGQRFERGDELAQASLTHTLLALNAGLMRIISSCMCTPPNGGTGSSRCDKLARQSLLSLSQTSAAEAVSSLQALRERLTLSASSGDPRARISQKAVRGRTRKDELARRPRTQQATRRVKQQTRKETAVISAARRNSGNSHASQQRRKTETSKARSVASEPVQGAWVRSKNHSSIYMATIPSIKHHQQSANLKPRNKHASGKQIDGPDYSKYARLDMSGTDQAATSSNEPVGYYTADQLESHSEPQSRSIGDATDKGQVEFPQCYHIRKDPPATSQEHNRTSILSISSGSTKLGEIPQHKWAVPWVPPMESTEDDEYLDDELGNGISDARRKNAKTRLMFWKRFAKN